MKNLILYCAPCIFFCLYSNILQASDLGSVYSQMRNPFSVASKSINANCSDLEGRKAVFEGIAFKNIAFKGFFKNSSSVFVILHNKNGGSSNLIFVKQGIIVGLEKYLLIAVEQNRLSFIGPFDEKQCVFSKNINYIFR